MVAFDLDDTAAWLGHFNEFGVPAGLGPRFFHSNVPPATPCCPVCLAPPDATARVCAGYVVVKGVIPADAVQSGIAGKLRTPLLAPTLALSLPLSLSPWLALWLPLWLALWLAL